MSKGRSKNKGKKKIQSQGVGGMIRALVVDPMGKQRCMRINSALGVTAVVASLAFYLFAQGRIGTRFPIEAVWVVAGWGSGLVLLWALALVSDRVLPLALFFGGLLIVAAVLGYTVFMVAVARAMAATSGDAFHVMHIPGILAGGLAYSLRLVAAFRPGRGVCEQGDGERAAKIGLILGGLCDLVVLFFVAWSFVS